MMRRSADDIGVPHAFDGLVLGRLTWVGLGIAAVGWALILGETTVTAILFARIGRMPPTFHADLIEIGKCVLISGFGLAIVGALQTGFGTLNRFFGAVLSRSGRRDPIPAPTASSVGTVAEPIVEARRPTAPSVDKRPYRLLPDGSVEVDTILGTRLFKTMAEARDFI